MATLLFVFAHPDDETVGCGGMMQRARARGLRVVVITATCGQKGKIRSPEIATAETLCQVRTQELMAAERLLGVDRGVFLGLPDGGLSKVPLDDGRRYVEAVLRAEDADVLVSFGEDGLTGHADHRAVAAWSLAAHAARPGVALWQVAIGEERARSAPRALHTLPDAQISGTLDLTEGEWLRKEAAIALHRSQRFPFEESTPEIRRGFLGRESFVIRGAEDLFRALGRP